MKKYVVDGITRYVQTQRAFTYLPQSGLLYTVGKEYALQIELGFHWNLKETEDQVVQKAVAATGMTIQDLWEMDGVSPFWEEERDAE